MGGVNILQAQGEIVSLFEDTAWDPKYKAITGPFVIIFAGIVMVTWGGCSDAKLRMQADDHPQPLTAAQLATDGPGDNIHVVITDYATTDRTYRRDETYYILVVPQPWEAGQASILLRTKTRPSTSSVSVPPDGLQGLAFDVSGTLAPATRKALSDLGPIDFDNVWIIDHHRKPPPWWSFLLKVGGGIALIAVGVVIFMSTGGDD